MKTLIVRVFSGHAIYWLTGVKSNRSAEIISSIERNMHTLLVEDKTLRDKYLSYLDINLIPQKYKEKKAYYAKHSSDSIQKQFDSLKLDEKHVFNQDLELREKLKLIASPQSSPCLAEPELLSQLPPAYFIVLEWDKLKDEGLIYAERLRLSNVSVEVVFYEDLFHGSHFMINNLFGYDMSRKALYDLVSYINKHI